MSSYRSPRGGEGDLSDERTDTTSESYRSEDTPNSIMSSDLEDKSLDGAPRAPTADTPSEHTADNKPLKRIQNDNISDNLSDSLVSKMSTLNLDSPKPENRPKNLGISPPKFSSTLVLTTSHPLMGTPDDFPDVVPKNVKEEDLDNSLSSIEDDKPNGNYYESFNNRSDSIIHRNNSKNNLYFSENFTSADSQILDTQDHSLPPDVARVKGRRRKIIPKLDSTPVAKDGNSLMTKVGEGRSMLRGQSTPKVDVSAVSVPESEYYSGVSWCGSPSELRAAPPFQLPVEPTATNGYVNGLNSPDVITSSTAEDRWQCEMAMARWQYEAHIDPSVGRVSLRPRPRAEYNTSASRRRIQVPDDDSDWCSADSVSGSLSLGEEEDLPAPATGDGGDSGDSGDSGSDDEDTAKRSSKSDPTVSSTSSLIAEYSLAEERRDERGWATVTCGGLHRRCDMNVIEPFKRVLSHGGYCGGGEGGGGGTALIVFSACHLPDTRRKDYSYVMEHLFLYVMWTLDRLVTEEYAVVYLHGSARARTLPSVRWLRDCYTLIDRRLRKSLKHLYLVHPTFWLKCFVMATKPFISSKFFKKLSYVESLSALERLVPTLAPHAIPDRVREYDSQRAGS